VLRPTLEDVYLSMISPTDHDEERT
jgi:hypothetical protein